MALEKGTARVSLGDDNFLTKYNHNAVVGLGQEAKWHIKVWGEPSANPFYIFVWTSPDSDEELVLTLDTNPGENENNIMVEKLETPRPKTSQLWTLEEAIMQPRNPPIVLARIQSVARPWLSAAIGGHIPLPRLYLNIAGVPNEAGSESQRWRLDYLSVEE